MSPQLTAIALGTGVFVTCASPYVVMTVLRFLKMVIMGTVRNLIL